MKDSTKESRLSNRRIVSLWPWLLTISIVLVIALVWFERGRIRTAMRNWTGEEDLREQIKGVGALAWLRLRHGTPETEPYVPIAHTGVCPFGVNTFLEQEVEPAKVARSLEMIADAGFCWIRQEFPWEDIEISAKGDFWDHKWDQNAWKKYDRIVDLADQYGLEVIARLDNPPAWSREAGDEIGTRAPPDDFQDFGDFVYAVVSRYRGRIRYYQIWNEPNIYPEWGEQPVDAAAYVRLLRIAYERAKEADPDCVVLSAGLAQTIEKGPRNLDDLVYLRQMYEAGAKDYFDIMGVMAYGLWTGPTDRRVSADRTNFSRPALLREIMVAYGDAQKPIWATEIGWNALPKDFSGAPTFGRVSPEQQARYAVRAYERARREWPWMGVLNYWFFKRATDLETEQPFYYFRLVEPDFTALPVYAALRDYANQPPMVHIGYHQEDHWALDYHGDWISGKASEAVLGGYRATEEAGAMLRFTFVGTDLSLVVGQGPKGGRYQITVDDRPPLIVDTMADVPAYDIQVPVVRGLSDGSHKVTLEVLGDGSVILDGLLVKRVPWYRSESLLWAPVILIALAIAEQGYRDHVR